MSGKYDRMTDETDDRRYVAAGAERESGDYSFQYGEEDDGESNDYWDRVEDLDPEDEDLGDLTEEGLDEELDNEMRDNAPVTPALIPAPAPEPAPTPPPKPAAPVKTAAPKAASKAPAKKAATT